MPPPGFSDARAGAGVGARRRRLAQELGEGGRLVARLQAYETSAQQAVLDTLHARLKDRLAVSSLAPCPVEFTAAFVGLCASQSCGKCTPCRVGLARLQRLIEDVLDERADASTLSLIESLAETIRDSADCAIGYEAANVTLQAVRGFRDDFVSHVERGCCAFERDVLPPCVRSCPAHVDIPGYIALVRAGRHADAVKLIRKDNPLPIACGLICEHPCELTCRRGMVDDPINIRAIKRYATDHMECDFSPAKAEPTGKTVAVIGGGPAGLTAAYYLALMGHEPTIFEQRRHLGGMMRYGIPAYRLPRERLQEEIDWICRQGVEVRAETSVGADVAFEDLRRDFDAVYIAIGAHADNKLGIPGEDATGVMSAVEMLRGIGDGEMPDFSGKRVAVVGGGNVAMDVARTSVRLGAASVDIVYRRRKIDMTAQAEEVEGAIAEGCNVCELMAPVEIACVDGRVCGLVVQPQIIGQMARGRFAPRAADVPAQTLPCDVVVVAIGQRIDSTPFQECGLPTRRGAFVCSNEGYIEGFDGVFTGGECATGPATVIKAVAAGKMAAANIDEYLGFRHVIDCDVEVPGVSHGPLVYCARSQTDERIAADRRGDFELIERGLSLEEVMQESSRCLRCDHFGCGAQIERGSLAW